MLKGGKGKERDERSNSRLLCLSLVDFFEADVWSRILNLNLGQDFEAEIY